MLRVRITPLKAPNVYKAAFFNRELAIISVFLSDSDNDSGLENLFVRVIHIFYSGQSLHHNVSTGNSALYSISAQP